MNSKICLFCNDDYFKKDIILENDFCYSVWDQNPVSKGHSMVIPKKHIESFFNLANNEIGQIYSLLSEIKNLIQEKYSPDGYNIGINEGEASGRTIHHLHIHLIPRYKGDVKNPRGGVRHVIPGKGLY